MGGGKKGSYALSVFLASRLVYFELQGLRFASTRQTHAAKIRCH